MNILVTGGAGFIGRWVVKKLLDNNHNVFVLDDLSNGSAENISEFESYKNFFKFINGSINDKDLLDDLFCNDFDLCFHLAANINVQDSIDQPDITFENDTIGTFNVLEHCRINNIKFIFVSTCMVYEKCSLPTGITELHPTKPTSPYSGSKIAAENIVLSYWYTYKLPVVVLRPFNTYGPFQKTNGEGGVVPIFINQVLSKNPINIYGNGDQTRDLLYVEDCANFIIKAGFSSKTNGEILNAGSGNDLSINDLATLISNGNIPVEHIPHIHPQSEISKLLCNFTKSNKLLNWNPEIELKEGIHRTQEWIKTKTSQKNKSLL